MGDEQVVQPAGTGKANLVGRVEDACAVTQQVSRAVESEGLEERLWGEPGPAAEQVMKFGRRDAGGFGDLLDLGLRAPVALDMGDGAANDVIVSGRGAERREVRQISWREHGGLHHLLSM